MLNLYLNSDVALEDSFPGTGTWHLSVVKLMLFQYLECWWAKHIN